MRRQFQAAQLKRDSLGSTVMRTPGWCLLLSLPLLVPACRNAGSRPSQTNRLAVHWADPDSSPQLQSYEYAWPAGVERAPVCRAQGVIIDHDSMGPLRVGQRLPNVLAQCPRALMGWDWGDEAIPEPALMVRFGSGTVMITLTDTSDTATVYYLSTTDTSFRTRNGLHVGQSIDSVSKVIGPLDFEEGECGLFASSKREPNLGLRLTLPADSVDCGNLVPKPPALPRGSRLAQIFLHSAA